MKNIFKLFFLPLWLFSNPFEDTLDNEQKWLEEETFVVSASKVKEDIKKSAASISIIDAEQIESMGANTLVDVLRTVPGLGIQQSQIFNQEIEVRGVKTWFSEKVLILLNGHSLNSLRNGGATLQYDSINLENIKRIEVVRGPASAVYGENAFTALINVITKSAEDIDGVQVSIKAGSYNTQSYNILYGKKINDISISANLNYVKSDGYKTFIAQDAVGNSGYTNPTTDKISAYLNLESKGFYFMGQYTDRKEGPRYGPVYALDDRTLFNYESYFMEIGYKKEISDVWSIHAKAYYDKMNVKNKIGIFPQGFPSPIYTEGLLAYSYVDEIKSGVELLSTYRQEHFTVVSGIMYELQQINNPYERQNYDPLTFAPYPTVEEIPKSLRSIAEVDRKLYAFYTELLYDISEDIRLTVGGRYDYFSDFGVTFNPRVGATWKANASNNFKMMYGEAFRAPTFGELYNQNNPTLVGNPDLNPEQIQTIEMSWQNSDIDNLDMTVTLFRSHIEDIIIINSSGQHENSDHIKAKGVEIELKYSLGRGSYLMGNYTYQDPSNKITKESIPDVSRHKAYMAFNYRLDSHYNLYIDANYKGEKFRSIGDTRQPVTGFIVGNATLLVKKFLIKDMKLRLSVYNMFDEKAYDSSSPFDYPIAQRSFMAELSYKF